MQQTRRSTSTGVMLSLFLVHKLGRSRLQPSPNRYQAAKQYLKQHKTAGFCATAFRGSPGWSGPPVERSGALPVCRGLWGTRAALASQWASKDEALPTNGSGMELLNACCILPMIQSEATNSMYLSQLGLTLSMKVGIWRKVSG